MTLQNYSEKPLSNEPPRIDWNRILLVVTVGPTLVLVIAICAGRKIEITPNRLTIEAPVASKPSDPK